MIDLGPTLAIPTQVEIQKEIPQAMPAEILIRLLLLARPKGMNRNLCSWKAVWGSGVTRAKTEKDLCKDIDRFPTARKITKQINTELVSLHCFLPLVALKCTNTLSMTSWIVVYPKYNLLEYTIWLALATIKRHYSNFFGLGRWSPGQYLFKCIS